MNIVSSFDTEKFFLGKLCKNGHDWQETSQTLRHVKDRRCVLCLEHYKQEYYLKNKERIQERDRNYHLANREKRVQYLRDYKAQNPEKVKQINKNYREKNRDKLKKACADWYKTNRDYAIQQQKQYRKIHADHLRESGQIKSRRRRAIKRNNHHLSISKPQIQTRFQEFQNTCAYCKKPERLTVDHFIPIVLGGSDVLGNLVPACTRCNFSKQGRDPKEWFTSQDFFSAKQWKFILSVLGKKESTYKQIPLF